MRVALKNFSPDGLTEDERLNKQESLWKRTIRPSGFDAQAYANQMRADNLRRDNGIGMIGYQFDVTFQAIKSINFPRKAWLPEVEKYLENGFVLKAPSGTGKTLTLLAALNNFRSPSCRVMLTSGTSFDGDFKFNKVALLNSLYLAIDDLDDLQYEPFAAKLFTQLYTVLSHREAKGLITFISCLPTNDLWKNERFSNRISRVGQIIS
jgi:DNA replication protein DnaC